MKLWRPVGRNELKLIEQSGWRAFPPRLPEQPIFYPVLNFPYAEQIARDWNSKAENHAYVGFVTEFDVDDDYVAKFQTEVVGGSSHKELWVPAEELEDFNGHIRGKIEVVAKYERGERVDAQ
ncbi:MAG: hypothetical protein JJ850_10910 [Kordiimonadaceae bacterium]|nr:hypothetical protein [Kordiimonadaceae bacterium]MBO6568905.1 hypothetical protein [Kordiimonadaceae bacterium]MBO6965120.1 hypothetical protein [Kordiimonadaceae bacterium]